MLAGVKMLLLAFAVMGVAATGASGAVIETPLSRAIEIHEEHLGEDSKLPAQAIKGQQTAYDHIVKSWENWLAKNSSRMPVGMPERPTIWMMWT